jgi:hypothetical protein
MAEKHEMSMRLRMTIFACALLVLAVVSSVTRLISEEKQLKWIQMQMIRLTLATAGCLIVERKLNSFIRWIPCVLIMEEVIVMLACVALEPLEDKVDVNMEELIIYETRSLVFVFAIVALLLGDQTSQPILLSSAASLVGETLICIQLFTNRDFLENVGQRRNCLS